MVSATHPFAATISANAEQAANRANTPLVRLERPGWREHPRSGSWTWVADGPAARAAAELLAAHSSPPDGGRCRFSFLGRSGVLVRLVDPPAASLPQRWKVILSRAVRLRR